MPKIILIEKTRKYLCQEEAATVRQIRFLIALCIGYGIKFPFSSDEEIKKYLSKKDAGDAISAIKDGEIVKFMVI
jgi:hypothetical protein